jgi:hypothetical protein
MDRAAQPRIIEGLRQRLTFLVVRRMELITFSTAFVVDRDVVSVRDGPRRCFFPSASSPIATIVELAPALRPSRYRTTGRRSPRRAAQLGLHPRTRVAATKRRVTTLLEAPAVVTPQGPA